MSSEASSSRRRSQHTSRRSTPPYPSDYVQRVYRACRLCARAKARCGGVTAEGCSRCRNKGKPCSLTIGMAASLDNGQPEDDLPAMQSNGHEIHNDDRSETTSDSALFRHRRMSDQRHHQQQQQQHQVSNNFVEDRVRYLEERLAAMEREQQRSWTGTAATALPAPTEFLISSTGDGRSSGHIDPTLLSLTAASIPSLDNTHLNVSLGAEADTIPIKRRRFDARAVSRSLARGTVGLVFDETAITLLERDDYPDIQKRGLLSAGQVEMAFHTFKHIFSRLIPMLPFLDVTVSAPRHPFVILAILAHLPDHIPEDIDIDPIIDESILYALTGAVSGHVVLALFILSLAPVTRHSASHTPVTALRFISLAYSIGCDIGFDERARSLAETETIYPRENLETVLLWSAVVNRYSLLRLQFTRISTLPHQVSLDLKDRTSPLIQQCIDHLEIESQIVDTCRDLISSFSTIEVQHGRQWPEISTLQASWESCMQKLDDICKTRLDGSAPSILSLDIPSIMYGLTLRMTCLLVNPWPPLSLELIQESQNLLVMGFLRPYIIKPYLIHRRQSPTLPVPRHIMTNLLGCLATTQRVYIILHYVAPDKQLPINLEELAEAEADARSQKGIAGAAVREMWNQLHEGYPPSNEQDPQSHQAQNGELSVPDLDFLGLEGFEWFLQNV
ncbi:hypothetical protein BCR39DRAFT_548503 [Naematelia encephala]|uniref:Zn(2)-C6 fungal-type domain-containing protein n=1 Tax=Naematelia encephala TaxID=71784 RepID=A0A1Y2AMK2_9TREE|nr:hypothetical protein BCR39DRAFT_548503 [Naematelia encephala]